MTKRSLSWSLAAVVLLGGCTGTEVKESVAGSFKSWCRQAENCTVHDDASGGGWAYGPHNP